MDSEQNWDDSSDLPAIGHCSFNPGTLEWKLYQRERKAQIEKLKSDREKQRQKFEQRHEDQLKNTKAFDMQFKKVLATEVSELAQQADDESKEHMPGPSKKMVHFRTSTILLRQKRLKTKNELKSTSVIKPVVKKSTVMEEGKQLSKSRPASSRPSRKLFKVGDKSELKSLVPRKSKSRSSDSKKLLTLKDQNNLIVSKISKAKQGKLAPFDLTKSRELLGLSGSVNKMKKISIKKKGLTSKKAPSCPQFPRCTAFPGTREWDEYWEKFHSTMETYNKEMAKFQKGMEEFSHDLAIYKQEVIRIKDEERIYKEGMDLLCPLPAPIITRPITNLTVFNGYVLKAKNLNAKVSNQLGKPNGIHVEIDVKGIDPDLILVDREFNMFTISINREKFVRIGVPDGKTAEDLEIHPAIYPQSIITVSSK